MTKCGKWLVISLGEQYHRLGIVQLRVQSPWLTKLGPSHIGRVCNVAKVSYSSLCVILTGGGCDVGGLILVHVGLGKSLHECTILLFWGGDGKHPKGSGHSDAAMSSVACATMVACSPQKLMWLAYAASKAWWDLRVQSCVQWSQDHLGRWSQFICQECHIECRHFDNGC